VPSYGETSLNGWFFFFLKSSTLLFSQRENN
jgi:hypothetical protein